ncbi:MAG: phytanoyl-CoA dioxygenase family protein [Betaproteobacteria bacterium]
MAQQPTPLVTDEDIRAYERDGVICLRQVFDDMWIARMQAAIDRVKANPGPLRQRFRPEDPGEFLSDKFMWVSDPDFRVYLFESPAAAIAGALMRSNEISVFYDQLLVKEPYATAPSPWHQDLNYWPFLGKQVCSVWMPLDIVDLASGTLEFVRGSQNWKDRPFSRALVFGNDDNQPKPSGDDSIPETDDPEVLPDIDGRRTDYDIVSWNMRPGDAVIFTALTLHSAPGNNTDRRRRAVSSRWTGDDVIYTPKRVMAKLLRDPGLSPGDKMNCDLFPVAWRA